jgi:hypothetical protein
MAPRTLSIPCSRCGSTAAAFTLHPPEAGQGRFALRREGFLSQTTLFGSREEMATLMEALETGAWGALEGRHPDVTAFHCRACQRSFCERCWSVGEAEYDDGFYDRTRGCCPHGHEQTLDD